MTTLILKKASDLEDMDLKGVTAIQIGEEIFELAPIEENPPVVHIKGKDADTFLAMEKAKRFVEAVRERLKAEG